MTYDERNKSDEGEDPAKDLKSYLSNPFYKLQETGRVVAKASIACKVELDENEFVEQFNPGMNNNTNITTLGRTGSATYKCVQGDRKP
eukprot:996376-Ditylum_brightwellii.AAC.1